MDGIGRGEKTVFSGVSIDFMTSNNIFFIYKWKNV